MLTWTWSPAELHQRQRPAPRVAGDRHPCPPDADGPPRSSRMPLGRWLGDEMESLAGGITSWNGVLLYYPAIFYLDKWTLGDSAPHFMCKRLINQNSDTFWTTAALLSLAEEVVKTQSRWGPSTPSPQWGFTNLLDVCVLLLRRWAPGCLCNGWSWWRVQRNSPVLQHLEDQCNFTLLMSLFMQTWQ